MTGDDLETPGQVIQRSEGVTYSEKYLKLLCERTFLRLWSYPGVYRDQSSGAGAKGGKEVCDLLVVFGEHIIIFSDKECAFPNTGNIDLNWSRWYRKAIRNSAEQLYGAERWIKNYPRRLFIDRECKTPFPIKIPESAKAKFHRVLVARGVSKSCQEKLGGSGSLMIHPEIIGKMHLIKIGEGGTPFTIGQIDPQKGYVHVLDDVTVDILLKHLDTITDFVSYLEKKEKLVESGLLIGAAGEEDLLGFYLGQLNASGEHDFVVPPDMNGIIISEGFWGNFVQSKQRKAQQEADKVSYAWDALIEEFSTHAMNRTQYFSTSPGVQATEKILRFMARESRTRRRLLANSLLELFTKRPKQYKATRVVLPSRPGDPYYVFLLLPHLERIPEEEYREVRRKLLEIYCRVTKIKCPEALDVIGIATESGTDPYRSEDAVYVDLRNWTAEMEQETIKLQEDLGLLKETTQYADRVFEYPWVSKSARRRKQRKRKENR